MVEPSQVVDHLFAPIQILEEGREREFLFPTVFITFCGDIVKQQLHGQLPSTTSRIKILGVKACARKEVEPNLLLELECAYVV
jgi:hypothetical protein